MRTKIKELWTLGWLFLFSLLSLLPFVFFRYAIHNDLAVQTFPLLLFANDAFRSKTLPLWDPFQNCGLPHFSNPQSHLWYLPHQLIFWTTGYSLYSIQYEFIFHFFLAGLCFYVLARRFKLSKPASCLSAMSYMLSGIFVGHSEHLNIMVTFVWVPLILAGIQGWLETKNQTELWLMGIGFWLLIQGGNPSTNLIALFLIGLFLLVRLMERIYDQRFNKILVREFLPIILALVLVLLISGISLLPLLADIAEYAGRQRGLPYQMALGLNPLRVWALVSLVLPSSSFATLSKAFEEPDSPTMLNCYFGLISLLLALFAVYNKRDRQRLVLLGLGVLGLLTALGARAFFRGLLYELVPFLRMLKHPALFRGIFILFFCLLAGFGLDDLISQDSQTVDKFRRAIVLILFILCLVLGFATVLSFALVRIDKESLMLLKNVFLESLPLQILLLLAFYFWLKSDRKYWGIGILFLASLDLSFMVQWNLPLMGEPFDYRVRKALWESVEKRERSVNHLRHLHRIDNWPELLNNGMVYKRFETADYTSNPSITFVKLMDSGFHKIVAEFPRFFLVPAVSIEEDLEQALDFFSEAGKGDFMPALVSEDPPVLIKVKPGVRYSREELDANPVKVIDYFLNRLELEFINSEPMILGTTEGYHPGWRARLDGKEVETIRFNFAFRGVYVLERGTHHLLWEFKPKSFYLGILVSALGIVLLGLWTGISFLRSSKGREEFLEHSGK